MRMYKTVFLCFLLLSIPVLEARRAGGGGGMSRGSSGARTSSAGGGSFNPNRGGGVNQGGGGFNQNHGAGQNFGNRGGAPQQNFGNQGGFRGQQGAPHYNYPSGFQQQGWNRSPGFSSGSGLGSASRASTFKHALAGAAIGTIGGLLVFEAGKAIINSATTPFHHANRDYYFDQQNYRGPSNVPRCSMPLSQLVNTQTSAPASSENGTSTEQTLANIQFRDGSKPKEVVWSCNVGEICCGSDCCPAPQSQSPNSVGGSHGGSSNAGWIALLTELPVRFVKKGCFCVYKFCRSAVEGFFPRSSQNQNYYDDSAPKYDQYGQPTQSYPMTQQNQYQQYPPTQNFGYPQQYPQTNQYPPNPGPRY